MTSVLCSTYVTYWKEERTRVGLEMTRLMRKAYTAPSPLCIKRLWKRALFFFVPSLLTEEHIFKSQDTSYIGKINLCGTVQTCWVFLALALCHMLYLCICVFVFLYVRLTHGNIILISLSNPLLKNISHVGYFWHCHMPPRPHYPRILSLPYHLPL